MAKWYNSACPKCGETVILSSLQETGSRITCKSCDTELEIAQMIPPKLKILARGVKSHNAKYFDTYD